MDGARPEQVVHHGSRVGDEGYGDKHEPEAGEDLGGDGPRGPLETCRLQSTEARAQMMNIGRFQQAAAE